MSSLRIVGCFFFASSSPVDPAALCAESLDACEKERVWGGGGRGREGEGERGRGGEDERVEGGRGVYLVRVREREQV